MAIIPHVSASNPDHTNKAVAAANTSNFLEITLSCTESKKELVLWALDFTISFSASSLRNCFFSASGIITFKNSLELQKTFKIIPLDKLLIETDSPFLAPVPNRGKKNEPSFIKFTAEKLSDIKSIQLSKLVEITTKNFHNLFSIN